MLNKDILERESWKVMEVDSDEKESGREVGNCVKGSRMRKQEPPPEEKLLPEWCLTIPQTKTNQFLARAIQKAALTWT